MTTLPAGEGVSHVAVDLLPRQAPVDAGEQEVVIARLSMANVRQDGQADGLFIEPLGFGGAPCPPAVLLAGMLGDDPLSAGRAGGVELSDARREPVDIVPVQLRPLHRFPFLPPGPDFGIGQTFLFGLSQRVLLDQQALPLIPLARAAPFEDYGRAPRVFLGTPGECSIAGGRKTR